MAAPSAANPPTIILSLSNILSLSKDVPPPPVGNARVTLAGVALYGVAQLRAQLTRPIGLESGFISIDIADCKMLKITRMFGDRAASISSAAGGRGFMHEGVSCFIFSRLDPSVIPKSRKELSMQ